MTDAMSKKEMIKLIGAEWKALEAVLDRLDRESMLKVGAGSAWSAKDIMAHISAWEKLMIQWLEESLRGETPNRPAPGEPWDDLGLFNERLYMENKGKSLGEVLREFKEIHRNAMKIVTEMQESDLLDPVRFEWRRGDPIWHLVAGNTWLHYTEHRQTISRWVPDSS